MLWMWKKHEWPVTIKHQYRRQCHQMKKDHQLSIPNSILQTTETGKENIGKGNCKRWNFFVNCKEADR